MKKGTCHRYGKVGHIAKVCKAPQPNGMTNGVKCHTFHQVAHLAKDCRSGHKRELRC